MLSENYPSISFLLPPTWQLPDPNPIIYRVDWLKLQCRNEARNQNHLDIVSIRRFPHFKYFIEPFQMFLLKWFTFTINDCACELEIVSFLNETANWKWKARIRSFLLQSSPDTISTKLNFFALNFMNQELCKRLYRRKPGKYGSRKIIANLIALLFDVKNCNQLKCSLQWKDNIFSKLIEHFVLTAETFSS